MKVEIGDLKIDQKEVTIEIPEEVVKGKVDQIYAQLQSSGKIKGFRPGKIPRHILKMHFGEKVKSQLISELVNEYFEKAIEEKGFELIGQGSFKDKIDFQENAPLSFTVIINIWPRIDLAVPYKGLAIEKEKIEVTEEQIESALREFQNQQAKFQVVEDRPIRESDQVAFDYQIINPETEKIVEEKQDVVVEVGPLLGPASLAAALPGLKKGESKEFEENFRPDYPNKALAGEKMLFKISIKEIKEKILPPLDDELAKDVGDYTLQSLREAISNTIKIQGEADLKQKIKNTLLEHLVSSISIEPPDSLVQEEVDRMIRQVELDLANRGQAINYEKSNMEALKANMRGQAIRKAKTGIILYEIACREGITVSPEEIDFQVNHLAKIYKEKPEDIKKSLTPEIKRTLREEKTLAFILEQASIREKG